MLFFICWLVIVLVSLVLLVRRYFFLKFSACKKFKINLENNNKKLKCYWNKGNFLAPRMLTAHSHVCNYAITSTVVVLN